MFVLDERDVKRYDPNQLRDPGGEGGGQWVRTWKVGERAEIIGGFDATTKKPVPGSVRGPVVRVGKGQIMINAGTNKKPKWVVGRGDQVRIPGRKKPAKVESIVGEVEIADAPREREKLPDIRQTLEQPRDMFSAEQRRAVRAYTGGQGKGPIAEEMNASLRAGRRSSKHDEVRKQLDSVFNTVEPLKAAGRVYRGGKVKGRNKFKPGVVFEDHGFVSTSPSRNQANKFLPFGGDMFEIVVPEGAKALDVNEAAGSGYGSEREVLLPRGTQLVIESVEDLDVSKGTRVIRATVVV